MDTDAGKPVVLVPGGPDGADVVSRAQGAWSRHGLAVGDGAFREMSDVTWLQVGPYFADLRRPRRSAEGARALGGNVLVNALNAARAFSGTAFGSGDRLTWVHDLDTVALPADHHDAAVVLRFADLLVEAGEGYVERWQSAGPRGAEGLVLERRTRDAGVLDARVVRVGNHAIGVWAAPARGGARLRRTGDGRGGWTVGARVGAQPLSRAVVSTMPSHGELAGVLADAGGPMPSESGMARWEVVAELAVVA